MVAVERMVIEPSPLLYFVQVVKAVGQVAVFFVFYACFSVCNLCLALCTILVNW